MNDTVLIELRTEELPPKSLKLLSEAFADTVFSALAAQQFTADDSVCTPYATPRRLAMTITHVAARQPDRVLERKGPAVASGVDGEGRPTRALEGFMRAAGVTFDQLHKTSDGKAEYFVARQAKAGEPLAAHLAEIVAQALKKLPIPKVMRWGDSEHQFVRPVHGLILLHGTSIVPGEVLGLASGRSTLGHRFLASGDIVVDNPAAYAPSLLAGKVIASFADRRAAIAEQLAAAAGKLGARINPADGLLDEVTALVEWPAVYVGGFEAEYLDVPQECLILTMQQNQKYFPLLDAAGKLLNKFLIVSNMQVDDPASIIQGNERVVRPRLADARFFYDQDRKNGFATRVVRLGSVVYHNKLGSLGDRAQRLGRSRAASPRNSMPTPTWPSGQRCSPRSTCSPTWSASSRNCRESWAATTCCTKAACRWWPTPSNSTTAHALPATRCPRVTSPAPPRWPTNSTRWWVSSVSASRRPATRIPSACAAPRSACCAS
jgi:glycyl-tRNA synthetase beta chain